MDRDEYDDLTSEEQARLDEVDDSDDDYYEIGDHHQYDDLYEEPDDDPDGPWSGGFAENH